MNLYMCQFIRHYIYKFILEKKINLIKRLKIRKIRNKINEIKKLLKNNSFEFKKIRISAKEKRYNPDWIY